MTINRLFSEKLLLTKGQIRRKETTEILSFGSLAGNRMTDHNPNEGVLDELKVTYVKKVIKIYENKRVRHWRECLKPMPEAAVRILPGS